MYLYGLTGLHRREERMRKTVCLLLSLLLILSLSGCGFKSGEELYALPQASAEYDSLQTCLQSILKEGLEYSAPLTGSNTQSVQLVDLDNDGQDEAIAFFRDSSVDSQSLKIYIFRKSDEDTYVPALTIEGNGTAINSALCCQLEGGKDSMYELLISWQLSTTVYSLSAYSLDNYTLTEMMSGSTYNKYAVKDMDQDGNDEITLIQLDSSDQSSNRAEYYTASVGKMTLKETVPLSQKMGSVDKIYDSALPGKVPALYITGFVLDKDGEVSSSTVVTDILALRKGSLTNISMGAAGENSSTTVRTDLVSDQDINGDGILEIPIPSLLENYDNSLFQDNFYTLRWQQYQLNGTFQVVCTTYHNTADGWYLTLPDSWTGHLSLMRFDTNTSLTVERSIVFYYRGSSKDRAEPFLAIYKNSGNDRQARSEKDNRIILRSDPDTIYSAEFFDCDWDCGLDETTLAEQFHLIQADWSTG